MIFLPRPCPAGASAKADPFSPYQSSPRSPDPADALLPDNNFTTFCQPGLEKFYKYVIVFIIELIFLQIPFFNLNMGIL